VVQTIVVVALVSTVFVLSVRLLMIAIMDKNASVTFVAIVD